MIIFSFPQYQYLIKTLKSLPDKKAGHFSVGRFPNQELFITLQTKVEDQDCLILGTVAPPDDQLLSLAFLSHTLKKEGAKKITALLPYLAYSRQDKDKAGESLATAFLGELLRASHISQVVTVDLHSPQVENLFPIPIVSLSPAKLFARQIKKLKVGQATLVAPDEGAVGRCEEAAREAKLTQPVAFLKKQRSKDGITHLTLQGEVSSQAIIIDDLLDTGGTLISACEKLQKAGVKRIWIMVTHGLFSGSSWKKLWQLGVKEIFCTDTIPLPQGPNLKKIKVISTAPLFEEFAKSLKSLAKEIKKAQKGVGQFGYERYE